MIKGFFFDLDGTLVGTYQADYLAYRDAIREVSGVDVPRDKFMALHGMEIGAKLSQLMPDLSGDQVLQIRKSKKRHYYNHVHLTELNAGLVSFLEQFSEHVTCVLVTTAKSENVAAVLGQHGLGKFFQAIISGDDVTRHKPDPEAYLLALEKTGLSPDQVIAFEDSEAGIQSAEAAGIAVVCVSKFAAV